MDEQFLACDEICVHVDYLGVSQWSVFNHNQLLIHKNKGFQNSSQYCTPWRHDIIHNAQILFMSLSVLIDNHLKKVDDNVWY